MVHSALQRPKKAQKSEFISAFQKIRSEGTLSHSQIDKLLSKRENMGENGYNQFLA